jgi:hypothetical protein
MPSVRCPQRALPGFCADGAPGFLPLDQIPLIRSLGGSQFRKFCVIALAILFVTVWTTCLMQEKERPRSLARQTNGGYVCWCPKVVRALSAGQAE